MILVWTGVLGKNERVILAGTRGRSKIEDWILRLQNIFDFRHEHLPIRHADLQPKGAGQQHGDSRAQRGEVVPSLWR